MDYGLLYPNNDLNLTLQGNALHNLDESIEYAEYARSGDVMASKFFAINYANFVELALKYRISKLHPILIYKDCFQNQIKISPKSKYISVSQAISFCNNAKLAKTAFLDSCKDICEMRNGLVHGTVCINSRDVRIRVGKNVLELEDFWNSFNTDYLIKCINPDNVAGYDSLKNQFEHDVISAQKNAFDEGNRVEDHCEHCQSLCTISKRGNKLFCHFCCGTENILACFFCSSPSREFFSLKLGNQAGEEQIACEECANGLTMGDHRLYVEFQSIEEPSAHLLPTLSNLYTR